MLALLDEAVGGAAPRPPDADRHQALVRDAAVLLSDADWWDRPLSEVAGALGVSAYHLARVFRSRTGYSLHGYRLQLRLRAALDQVAERPRDLAGIAADLGFAHHSHLTRAFRATFGSVPSRHTPARLPETLRALVAA
ncbi:MAG: helix-turn-helix transcriptional regulator [Nocardioides sp.]